MPRQNTRSSRRSSHSGAPARNVGGGAHGGDKRSLQGADGEQQVLVQVCNYDVVVIASRVFYGEHYRAVRAACPDAKLLFDTLDLNFLTTAREAITGARAGALRSPWDAEATSVKQVC